MKTTTHTNSTQHSETFFGAGIAFVAFLLTGAMPAVVYGGYTGLILSNIFFGSVETALTASRWMTGAGMVVGVLATLSLYLVIGAGLGAAVGARRKAAVHAAATHRDAAHADR